MGSWNNSSSSMIATAGLWGAKLSSSLTARTSISGLPSAEGEEVGVSIAGSVESTSLPDSTLILVLASSPPFIILEGVVGEGGEEGIDSSGRAVRRFMVTLLEFGSGGGGSGPLRGGV
jgi:hypothetical protein